MMIRSLLHKSAALETFLGNCMLCIMFATSTHESYVHMSSCNISPDFSSYTHFGCRKQNPLVIIVVGVITKFQYMGRRKLNTQVPKHETVC